MNYWEHRKPVQRARAVDLDEVAQTAVALLNNGGLRALTVRATASHLGVAPASLYSRIESVDDLFDLALDWALGRDLEVQRAIDNADLLDLIAAYHQHLVAHPWSCQVIAMRAPRGPHYLRFSEQLCQRLITAGVPHPLATAYTLSNFAIGSATTAHVASDERTAQVDRSLAPTYAHLHQQWHDSDAEAVFKAGLNALLSGMATQASIIDQPSVG